MANKEKMESKNIKLPVSLWKRIEAESKERECTAASVVRYALKKYFNGAK